MKKILIVDDETVIVEVLRDLLQESGYQVFVAMDGMQAIMQAVKYMPDLILLDISMPAGGGTAVYNRLKQSPEAQTIPVVFLTAMPPADLAQKLPFAQNVTVFRKPFKQKELLDLIQKMLKDSPVSKQSASSSSRSAPDTKNDLSGR